MKISTLIVAAAMAIALPANLVLAQTTTTTTGTPSKPVTETTATKVTKKMKRTARAAKTAATTTVARSANSLACSADATAKGLKGKPRKAFRRSCLAMKAKAA